MRPRDARRAPTRCGTGASSRPARRRASTPRAACCARGATATGSRSTSRRMPPYAGGAPAEADRALGVARRKRCGISGGPAFLRARVRAAVCARCSPTSAPGARQQVRHHRHRARRRRRATISSRASSPRRTASTKIRSPARRIAVSDPTGRRASARARWSVIRRRRAAASCAYAWPGPGSSPAASSCSARRCTVLCGAGSARGQI